MASATESAKPTEIYDQLCATIAGEQDAANVSLKTAQILMWDVGSNSLVGLEAGGDRAVFHCADDAEFVAAIPFDESGVHGDDAELLAREEGVREGLEAVEYEWVHPEYRGKIC